MMRPGFVEETLRERSSREWRLRLIANALGLAIERGFAAGRLASGFGAYRIVDAATRSPLSSTPGSRACLDLDEVEMALHEAARQRLQARSRRAR